MTDRTLRALKNGSKLIKTTLVGGLMLLPISGVFAADADPVPVGETISVSSSVYIPVSAIAIQVTSDNDKAVVSNADSASASVVMNESGTANITVSYCLRDMNNTGSPKVTETLSCKWIGVKEITANGITSPGTDSNGNPEDKVVYLMEKGSPVTFTATPESGDAFPNNYPEWTLEEVSGNPPLPEGVTAPQIPTLAEDVPHPEITVDFDERIKSGSYTITAKCATASGTSSKSITVSIVSLDFYFIEAAFTGGNTVPRDKVTEPGLQLVLNDDFDCNQVDASGNPVPDNSNATTKSNAEDRKDIGQIVIGKLPSVASSCKRMTLTKGGSGNLRFFHTSNNSLFWDTATDMTDAQAETLCTILKTTSKSFYIEGYGAPGTVTLDLTTSGDDESAVSLTASANINLIKTTRWLVTPDSAFEAKAQTSNSRFKQAALTANKATVIMPSSDFTVKLTNGSTEIEAVSKGGGVYELAVSAQSDEEGNVYIAGNSATPTKLGSLTSPATYTIKAYGASSEPLLSYPITVGPLLKNLSFSPDILSKTNATYNTLDPYENYVDVKWDFHLGSWVGIDEDGYGLNISYLLNGDLNFADADNGKSKTFMVFKDSNGGDMGGNHALLISKEFMKKSSFWSSLFSSYSLKWEGFDSSISDEDAVRMYKFPNQAKNDSKWISPANVVKEGEYLLKIKSVYSYDTTQEQNLEIKFNVKYK